jgi:hypothetical protein
MPAATMEDKSGDQNPAETVEALLKEPIFECVQN